MFFLNVGYRRHLTAAEERLDGALYVASGNDLLRLSGGQRSEHGAMLFDPQLYLSTLDAAECSRVCARLATYQWFGVPGLPPFDSNATTRRDWMTQVQNLVVGQWPGRPATEDDAIDEACLNAISFQLELGCTQIILPSPLLTEPADEGGAQSQWLDGALRMAELVAPEEPLLATVALRDSVLTEDAFTAGGLLDTVADQVTARPGLAGVYIVIEQTAQQHPFDTPDRVLRAYLRLCRAFAAGGYATVLPNFIDVFGLACVAVGATGFANGPSHALRRLCPSSFRDEGFGVALPHFYSHRIIGELLPEQDLDRIANHRLLARVRDLTPHSQALMDALARGGSAANLVQWAESRNNQTTSSKHFIRRLLMEEFGLQEMGADDRLERIRDWLIDADATATYVARRIGGNGLIGKVAPAQRWLAAVDTVATEQG
jgi:hypothetical protein